MKNNFLKVTDLLIVILLSNQLYSNNLDSLLTRLNKVKGEEKVELLCNISDQYINTNQLKSLQYAKMALENAEKLKQDKLIARSMFCMGNIYISTSDWEKSSESFQLSANLFKKEKLYSDQIDALVKIGYILKQQQKYNEAIEQLDYALNLAKEKDYKKGIASATSYKGSVYWNQGKFSTAVQFYKNALNLTRKIGSELDIAKALNNVALANREIDRYEKSLKDYKEALEIYKKNNYKKNEATTLNYLGSLYWRWNKYDSSIYYYNKSLNISKELNDKKAISKLYINIARVYNNKYEVDSSIIYYIKAQKIYESIGDSNLIAESHHNMGNYLFNYNNYDNALEYYNKALKIRKSINDKIGTGNTLNTIGTVYSKSNKFKEAFDAYNEAIFIFEKLNNKSKLAYSYMLLGNLNQKIDPEEAAKNYEKALNINKAIGDKNAIAKCILNLGVIDFKANRKMVAITKFQKVSEMLDEMNDNSGQCELFSQVANLYNQQNRDNETIKYLKRAISYGIKGNNYEKVALSYRKLGNMYYEKNNIVEASKNVQLAIEYGLKSNKIETLKDAYHLKYLICKAQNQYKLALDYFEKYTELDKLIGNEIKNNQVNQYKIDLQINQLNAERERITNQNNIQAIKLSKQKNILLLLIIISVLIALIFVVIFNRYRIKKKSEEKLRMLNVTKDKFFSIIAHDLKNPLSGMIGITNMIKEDKEMKPEKIREFNSMILISAKQLFELLENLLDWARSQTNRIKYSPEGISMKTIIDNTVALFKTTANDKNIILSTDIEGESIVFADKEMITTVTRNLVSNAIKFTKNNGTVSVRTKTVGHKIEISINDSGVGISEENIKKLFKLDTHISTKGTQDEEGTGLGLILCKEFVDRNHGEINVVSQIGKGSSFKIILPKFGSR